MIKVGINGFGRIGRILTRVLLQEKNIEVCAINELADSKSMAHLLKYDSVHGRLNQHIEANKEGIVIDGKLIMVSSEIYPENIPWKKFKIDIVIDCTGKFKSFEKASGHLKAGAKKVIVSAPPEDDSLKTIVLGINEEILEHSDLIVSNASCTTNSAAPLLKILHENLIIESAYITTVHSFTTDQKLHDSYHNDLRRARAATQSIVPTTTGAAKALTKIFPDLKDVIGGCGIRVPVPDGSLTDLSCVVKQNASIEEINNLFKAASKSYLNGILEYSETPLVSVDIIGNSNSCIFDSELTSSIGKMVKVVGWYDNEWGYSNRLKDLILRLSE